MTKCEEQFEIKLGSDFLLRVGKHSKNTAKPASTAESCAWAIQLADCPSALSSSDLFIFTLLFIFTAARDVDAAHHSSSWPSKNRAQRAALVLRLTVTSSL